LARVFFEIPKA